MAASSIYLYIYIERDIFFFPFLFGPETLDIRSALMGMLSAQREMRPPVR